MREVNGNQRVRSILTFAVKAIAILAVSTILLGFGEVDNALHPPRIIPPGNTLRKYNVPYQSVEIITEDGIHLSAWHTPSRNGAVILLAHGYGDNRPEWVYEMLARKGYGILAWDARAHGVAR